MTNKNSTVKNDDLNEKKDKDMNVMDLSDDPQGNVKKVKDFSAVVDVKLPETSQLASSGQLINALEQLTNLEKQTRNGADVLSNSRVLVHILNLCFEGKAWNLLNENIQVLSKKHGLLKTAVNKMIQQAITFIEKTPDEKTKLELIETLRTVTEGKIFVEVERARVTKVLADMKEKEGNINEAADILQELQVETFGSMDKREKTEFILEQMRLCLAKKDFTRVQVISRKISGRFFENLDNQDLKLSYYKLLIEHGLHDDSFLNVCKYYRQIYDTPNVQKDESQWQEALINIIIYIVLSPYDNEQSDLIHRIGQDTKISKLPLLKQLLKSFTTSELMRWPKVQEIYGASLQATHAFNTSTEDGVRRWKALHNRVIEHNIRVISKYYTRISMKRLESLLDLSNSETEEFLSKLVVSKTVFARIDRPAGIVNFVAPKNPNELLNDWSHNISSLLELIEKTNHLIAKEEMVHSITKVM